MRRIDGRRPSARCRRTSTSVANSRTVGPARSPWRARSRVELGSGFGAAVPGAFSSGWRRAGRPLSDRRHARAGAARHRGAQRRARDRERPVCEHRGPGPSRRPVTTVPGIGPITATAYVAALDDAARFGRAAQVASYLGLVPREYSSGEQQRRGRCCAVPNPMFNPCSFRPAGVCGCRRIRGRPVFAAGHKALRTDEGRPLRWSPWPGASRASCLRCGEMAYRMTRSAPNRRAPTAARRLRKRQRRRPARRNQSRSSSWRRQRDEDMWPLLRAVP